ncbi:MAG: hypothetical protein AAGA05_12795 [Pseudomonadota bacterium]
MKIMICGGYEEAGADDQPILQFVRALAAQVIEQGHDLRSGNTSSLDAIAVEAACAACDAKGIDPEDRVVSHIPLGGEARTLRGNINESSSADWGSIHGKRPSVPEPIDEADVIILVGGYGDATGTYTASFWARQSGTPVLPVASFGMAAREIYEDFKDKPDLTKLTGLTVEDITKLTTAQAALAAEGKMDAYAQRVVALAEKAALSREVFLIMSFAGETQLEDYKDAIETLCKEVGFDAVRTDTRPTTDTHQIIDEIHNMIESCGFVIADLSNERPNVYYEIGYARGLEKKVILTAKKGTQVHFDLQGLNRYEWEGSANLKEQLRPVLKSIAAEFGLTNGDV